MSPRQSEDTGKGRVDSKGWRGWPHTLIHKCVLNMQRVYASPDGDLDREQKKKNIEVIGGGDCAILPFHPTWRFHLCPFRNHLSSAAGHRAGSSLPYIINQAGICRALLFILTVVCLLSSSISALVYVCLHVKLLPHFKCFKQWCLIYLFFGWATGCFFYSAPKSF